MRQISMAEWTRALVETIFTRDNRDKPVFLDLEAKHFFKINELLDLSLESNDLERIPQILAADVRRYLSLGENAPLNKAFEWFDEEMKLWQTRELIRDQENLPNWLPLLACFSLAAEKMGEENGLGIHNYYGRLCEIFEVSADNHERFTDSMHKSGHELWRGLNKWLESLQWQRGRGTARQIGHLAHVGWALSQALIRDLDRNRVKQFVSEVGYPDNYELSNEDAQEHLHDWLVDGLYQPRVGIDHLRRIFLEKSTRLYLVDLLKLFAYEGVAHVRSGLLSGEKIGVGSLMNVKSVNLFPPKWQINLQLVIDSSAVTEDSQVEIVQGNNQVKVVDLVPITDSQYAITIHNEEISSQSIIEKSFTIRLVNDGVLVAHGKKSAVPIQIFREDENGFFTAERLAVGQRHNVLVNMASPIFKLARDSGVDIEEMFREISDGTYQTYENIESSALIGLPDKWRLFQDVFVLAPLSPDSIAQLDNLPQNIQTWLTPLIPRKLSSIIVNARYKVPGRSNAYLHNQSLSIAIFAHTANGGVLSISNIDTREEIFRETFRLSFFEYNLNHLKLAPGRYNIEFKEGSHVRNSKFSLDVPSNSSTFSNPPSLWWPNEEVPQAFDMPNNPMWTYSREKQYGIIEVGDESTCSERNHIWRFPTQHPPTYQIGTCEICEAKVKIPYPPRSVLHSPKKIEFRVREVDKDIARENVHAIFDLLSFVPVLQSETLRGILSQFGCSNPQDYWNAKMKLLSKGIIRISSEVDDLYEVCPPTLNVNHSISRITLSGCWTSEHCRQLILTLDKSGTTVEFEPWDSPRLTQIKYDLHSNLKSINAMWKTREITDTNFEFPSIFDVLSEAQTCSLDEYDEYEYFDAKNTAWISLESLPPRGLVRRRNQFPRHYYFIDDEISKEVDMITGKHLAGIDSGTMLFAYDSILECLVVPWGVQFSIAAENLMQILGSSSAVPSQEKNALIYQEVSPNIARVIISNTYRRKHE